MMNKIIGVTGSGAIGVDPFAVDTWSGSSHRFFKECQRQGVLEVAFGTELSKVMRTLYILKNYNKDKIKWKRLFYMDIGYRDCLSKKICKIIVKNHEENYDFLQIGAMFDTKKYTKNINKHFSYNDGNFYMSFNSPYFPKDIPVSRIEKTLNYEIETQKKMDKIFTMSEYLRKSFIENYGIHESKVCCIGAGINQDSLPSEFEKTNYDNKKILFIGAEFKRKGGETLLKAFDIVRQRLPGVTLDIVGSFPEKNNTNMSGITCHGFINKNEPEGAELIDSLFRSSSLFVMPSLYEPFGIAPLEAMSYYVPAIVSNDWALPEVVPEHVCGELVEPGNYEDLAEKISSLLINPDLLKKYGTSGRIHVENNYTWEKVVDRLALNISS